MLSKVLARADRSRAQLAVFPAVGEPTAPAAPDATSTSEAKWRERVHDLEMRIQAEKKEAFEAGLREGELRSRTEWQPVVDRLNRSVSETLTTRSEMRRRAERDAVQLALLIAHRVLHRELSVDENALAGVARVAFDRIARSESYRVTVHPRFAAALTAALPASQHSRIHIEPDPDCAPGTLVIHSAEGTIDASVETQLEEITRGLTDRLAHSC
jgi:flagellar assembly protein FliH